MEGKKHNMEETQTALGDPSVAALAAVLRIFAARGRAIHEAQEKQEKPSVPQRDYVELESKDLQQSSEVRNSAREKVDDTSP